MPENGNVNAVCVITGGARGMGFAHARALGRAGRTVVIVDIDGDELEHASTRLTSEGIEAYGRRTDIRDRASCEALVEHVAERFGRIDVLVHNAGMLFSMAGLADTDDDDFEAILGVNVRGPLYLTRAALPWLRKSSSPRVVFVSSQWGQVPAGHSYGYMTSKAAQLGLMKTMATEFAADGILVNAVTPGAVATRMVSAEDAEGEAALIPIGRLGQPEEIANVVAFLASDAASFITGQVIGANGGALIVGI
jgi:3-oxoacyl-[acyl-carrier protein] reductase